MKLNRNPEFRNELLIYIGCTVAAAVAGAFVSPACAALVFALGAVLTAAHFFFGRRRYSKIEELSSAIDKILHGQEEVLISGSEEGELSILTSEVHKMTARLREQTDQLRDDKIRLTQAIEDIFHQMRTPLTSLNLIVTILGDENLTYEKRVGMLRDMKKQLARMQWLVETLLKMSKIDAGTAQFRIEPVKLRDIIENAAEPFLIPVEVRGQELVINTDDSELTCDRTWTQEALGNIIKNCMEHNAEGGKIFISAAQNALFTEIEIRDNGQGFSKEDIPYLFERFYKGSNSSSDSIGIGLALTRMIVTAQNGTITAENAQEGGARFIIKFYKSIV